MKTLAFVAAAVVCLGVAHAEEEPAAAPTASAVMTSAPPPPAAAPTGPPAEMQELNAFIGTWTCEGTFADSMAPPTIKMKSRLEFKPDLRGYWISGREERDKVVSPPGEERLLFWSFDPVMHQYVGGWLNSRGGWSTQTSFGWMSDQLVMFGHVTALGNRLQGREIFKRPVDGAFARTYELLDPATNEWTRVAESTCRVSKPAAKTKRR